MPNGRDFAAHLFKQRSKTFVDSSRDVNAVFNDHSGGHLGHSAGLIPGHILAGQAGVAEAGHDLDLRRVGTQHSGHGSSGGTHESGSQENARARRIQRGARFV